MAFLERFLLNKLQKNAAREKFLILNGPINQKLLRFIIVGGVATLIHFIVFSFLIVIGGMDPQIGNLGGYIAAFCVSFLGNSFWSFGIEASLKSALRFIFVSLLGFILNAIFVHFVTKTLSLPFWWAAVGIVGITPWFSYQLSSKWVFSSRYRGCASYETVAWYRPLWKLVLAWLILDCIFFRHFYLSGGDLIFGDYGDSRIVLALLEHWVSWWDGSIDWKSPNFFYPQVGVLGYTDTYFLFALPHIIFRSVGLDPYLSMEGAFHLMKLIGFVGMAWFIRSRLKLSLNLAIMGASLFYVLNNQYWHSMHMQLSAVALSPWLIGLGLMWINEGQKRSTGLLIGVLLPAFLLTSFYMAWFTAISLLVLLIIALVTRREVLEKGFVFRSIPGLVLFLIGTTPFLYLYLPVLLDKEGHGFSTVLNNALYPVEFIRVGGSNLIWGWLEEEFFSAEYPAYSGGFSYIPNYERIAGFSPFLAMLFFISSFFIFRKNLNKHSKPAPEVNTAAILAFSGLFFWLISARYGNFTLWQLVYEWLPGASAVRVPSRILLFVAVFVIPVIMFAISRLIKMQSKSFFVAPLVLLIFAEQINTAPLQKLSRSAERARLDFVESPPRNCKSFYVSSGQGIATGYSLLDGFYIPNIDAMILATRWKIPTLNGISTWFPDGWALHHPGTDSYKRALEEWVRLHAMEPSSVCGVDLSSRKWNYLDLNASAAVINTEVFSLTTEDAKGFLAGGWSRVESWGVWSVKEISTLQFIPTEANRGFELQLQAYRAEERPIKLEITIVDRPEKWNILIDESTPAWHQFKTKTALEADLTRVQIKINEPRRPSEWGDLDSRKLGIGLRKIRLLPAGEK